MKFNSGIIWPMVRRLWKFLFTAEVGEGPWPNLPEDARYFSKRADAVADQQRKGLFTLHTSALGVLFAAAAWFASEHEPTWAIYPGFFFFMGLVLTNISYVLAKGRATTRSHAAREDKGWPKFPERLHSLRWDLSSLGCFILGVVVALIWLPR